MPPEKGPAPTQVKSEVAKDSCENREEVDTSGEATRRVQEVTTTITTSCITEMEGDLFDAPENAVLIHACNCKGSWGAGIAKVFKDKYPHAFNIYKAYCDDFLKQAETRTVVVEEEESKEPTVLKRPEGEVLVIPPQPGDYEVEDGRRSKRKRKVHGPHWVACLFTSVGFGKGRSGEEEVLRNTRLAVEELKRDVEGRNGSKSGVDEEIVMGELWGCRFNAGLFGVEWERTKGVLEDVGLAMKIVRPSD